MGGPRRLVRGKGGHALVSRRSKNPFSGGFFSGYRLASKPIIAAVGLLSLVTTCASIPKSPIQLPVAECVRKNSQFETISLREIQKLDRESDYYRQLYGPSLGEHVRVDFKHNPRRIRLLKERKQSEIDRISREHSVSREIAETMYLKLRVSGFTTESERLYFLLDADQAGFSDESILATARYFDNLTGSNIGASFVARNMAVVNTKVLQKDNTLGFWTQIKLPIARVRYDDHSVDTGILTATLSFTPELGSILLLQIPDDFERAIRLDPFVAAYEQCYGEKPGAFKLLVEKGIGEGKLWTSIYVVTVDASNGEIRPGDLMDGVSLTERERQLEVFDSRHIVTNE